MHRVLSVVGWRPREAPAICGIECALIPSSSLDGATIFFLRLFLSLNEGERDTASHSSNYGTGQQDLWNIKHIVQFVHFIWRQILNILKRQLQFNRLFSTKKRNRKRTGRRLNLDDRQQGDYIYFIIRLFATHPPIKCGFKYKFNAIYNANGRQAHKLRTPFFTCPKSPDQRKEDGPFIRGIKGLLAPLNFLSIKGQPSILVRAINVVLFMCRPRDACGQRLRYVFDIQYVCKTRLWSAPACLH